MSEYDIWLNSGRKLWEWINTQPNLVLLKPFMGDRIYCQFNHTPTEEIAFKQEIANRLSQIDIGNSTFENTIEKMTAIQTDQYVYGTEVSVTKTNIGTTYTNIFTDYGGRPFGIDTTGFTKMAIHVLWNKVGTDTGVQTVRIINDADSTQIVESTALATGATINRFNNVSIPQAFRNFIGNWRLQAKSTVAADDPVFNGIRIYLRR